MPDWNVGELKINVGSIGSISTFNHLAASSCYRFNAGVSSTSGKWYLPSMGELGYLLANINKINIKINALGSGMGVAISDPATWETGVSGIPEGWTVEDAVL